MSNINTLAPLCLLATAVVIPAHAENTSPEQTFALDTVTVSATLTEEKLGDVASSVSVINAEKMDTQGVTNIHELMRYEPGVEVGTSTRFGQTGFNIRGLDGNQVKIVVDGVDQAKSFTPGGDFQRVNRSFYDMDSMKQVEALKGPASSLYGSNAIGGVVSFTTKDPADFLNESGDDTGFSIKTQHTSKDSGNHATLAAANRSGPVETLLMYTRRDFNETDNQGTVGGEGDTRTKSNPEDNQSNNLLAKAQYQINDQHRIGVTLEQYELTSESELLTANQYNDYSAFFGPGAFLEYADKHTDDSLERDRLGIEHQWLANNVIFDKLNWTLNQQKTTSNHKTYDDVRASALVAMIFGLDDGPRLKDYSHEENSTQFSAKFDKIYNRQHFTYGLDYEDIDFNNETNTHYLDGSSPSEAGRYVPKVTGKTYGLFAQDKITLAGEKLIITPAIRYDNFEAKPEADSRFTTELKDHDSDNISVRLGGLYKFTKDWSIFAQYAQGFKTPELYQMYYERDGGTYISLANPDLKPEESDSFEIGFRQKSSIGNMEITAFYNDYKNYIESQVLNSNPPYTGGVTQYINIADANIKGLEFRGALWLDEALNAPTGTTLQTSIAYAKGENKTNDEPIDSIAPLTAVIGLVYDSPNNVWGSTLNWTVVKKKDIDDVSDASYATTSGYGILDLIAYYNITKSLKISGGIFNLTDKAYTVWEDLRGQDTSTTYQDRYTQPGINFSANISYDF